MLTDRSRAKSAAAAQELLPAGRHVSAYAVGRGQARLTTPVVVVAALLGAAFVVGLTFGVLLYPGWVVIVFVLAEVRPRRGLAVTEDGVTLMACSRWTGRPTEALGTSPALTIGRSATGRTVLEVAWERVTFSGREASRLPTTAVVAGVGLSGGHLS